jgi:hypothetical protein
VIRAPDAGVIHDDVAAADLQIDGGARHDGDIRVFAPIRV